MNYFLTQDKLYLIVPYEENVVLSFERVDVETYSFYFGNFSLLLTVILFRRVKDNV